MIISYKWLVQIIHKIKKEKKYGKEINKEISPEFSLWVFDVMVFFELFIDRYYEKHIKDHNLDQIKHLVEKVDRMFNNFTVHKVQYLILENKQEIDSDTYFVLCDEILDELIKYIHGKKE